MVHRDDSEDPQAWEASEAMTTPRNLSTSGLPPYLARVIRLAQQVGCSFTLMYSESEDTWYAEMSGPGTGESWEVKRWPTAVLACDALCRQVGETMAPNGRTYADIYASAFRDDENRP